MSAQLDGYPGAKGGAGVYQTIINAMPPHDVYVEAFAGSAAIFKRKRPAEHSLLIERDPAVFAALQPLARTSTTIVNGDAISHLRTLGFGDVKGRRVLVYADPPYWRDARRSPRAIYAHEFTDADHAELLDVLCALPFYVMLSGYRCALYDDRLASWRRLDFPSMTRGGLATESLWCNFPETGERHEYTYLGVTFRERERIKRKKLRWTARLARMPQLERAALLEALLEHRQGGRCAPAGIATAGEGGQQSSGPEALGP